MIPTAPPQKLIEAHPVVHVVAIATPVVVNMPGNLLERVRFRSLGTGSGIHTAETLVVGSRALDTASGIKEVKQLSGLTWKQISEVFNVSPRALHLWADGGRLDAPNADRLFRVLDVVRVLEPGLAPANRAILMAVLHHNQSVLDLLAKGDFESARRILKQEANRRGTKSAALPSIEPHPSGGIAPGVLMAANQNLEGVEPYVAVKRRSKPAPKV